MPACEVLLNTQDCTRATRAKCFACGNSACTGCSKRMVYGRFGRQRVCNDCQEDRRKEGKGPRTPFQAPRGVIPGGAGR